MCTSSRIFNDHGIITKEATMKFVISTQELNYLINKCQSIIPSKVTIPILSNFLIEAINDELIITSTDLTVGIRCFLEAKILEEGSTTVPAKKFAQLIRELTSSNVQVSTNANHVTEVSADSSRFKLNGMDRAEFPSLPDVTGSIHFKISQSQLKDMLYRTAFAVSREDNRYVLTGVYMHFSNSTATFVGTDGKRLAKSHLSVDLDPSFTGNYIIPLKAVEEIVKNLEEEGDATIYLMNDKVAIESTNTMIITKLLSGEYPDYNRVIPQNPETLVALHREELMSLLRQISLFTTSNNDSVRFTFSEGELRLTANTMEIGEGKVSMPVNYQGQMLEIAFNPGFFLDILRHSKNETVTMGVTDSYNPGLITDQESAPNPIASSPLFVLMPMRLNEE
jgi:DNA polymerase-3 subunit beta